MKTRFLITFVVCTFIGCSEKSNEFFDPSYWSGPYQGITFTDRYGRTLNIDPDDWCIKYSTTKDSLTTLPSAESYAFIPAFPNPVNKDNEKLNFWFYLEKESYIEIYINNERFRTIKILANSTYERGLNEIKWDLTDTTGNKVPSGIYRCYMTAEDFSCYGDIWIK